MPYTDFERKDSSRNYPQMQVPKPKVSNPWLKAKRRERRRRGAWMNAQDGDRLVARRVPGSGMNGGVYGRKNPLPAIEEEKRTDRRTSALMRRANRNYGY